MRLQTYLTEAIIQPQSKDIKAFRKYISQVQKKYILFKYDRSKKGINKAMTDASKLISKEIKDIHVKFKPTKSYTTKGAAMIDSPKHYIEMEYNSEEAFFDWQNKDEFKVWLDTFMNLVYHELIHIQQFRRLLKVKGNIQQVKDILADTRFRADDKYGHGVESYLSDHMEIMAHAKKASTELLQAYEKEDILSMLKNTNEIEELSFDSSDFNSYYTYIKPYYPSIWKKFIKYFTSYLK